MGTTWSLDARAEETRHRPATPARILSTKRGPTTSSATHSTRSRISKPIRDFRNSSAGFTNSRTPPSSGPGEIAPEPVSPIADNRAVRCRGFFVPIAQSTERECPKLQVAGESPAGDAIFADVVQQQNAAVPRPRRRCNSVHPLHFGGVAHQQSARLTRERQRGRHSPLPPSVPVV